MKITRILILGLAAWGGYYYYNRYHALLNVMDVSSGDNFGESYTPSDTSGKKHPDYMGNIGGLGAIGSSHGSSYFSDQFPTAVSSEDSQEEYLLMQAAAKGNADAVKKMLAKGVKPDGRDHDRRTALMYASWNGHNDICGMLMEAGAKARFEDRNGNNAYDYAASRGLLDTVQFLLNRSGASDDGHDLEYAAVIAATISADPSRLPAGDGKLASVNRLTPEDQSPLHIAANNDSVALAAALIARGADVNKENNDQQTPLHWAAWNNRVNMMALLIDKGADISARDAAGDTPLILAVQNHSVSAAQFLLQHGADKNIANLQEKTALTIAHEKGFTDLVALLQ